MNKNRIPIILSLAVLVIIANPALSTGVFTTQSDECNSLKDLEDRKLNDDPLQSQEKTEPSIQKHNENNQNEIDSESIKEKNTFINKETTKSEANKNDDTGPVSTITFNQPFFDDWERIINGDYDIVNKVGQKINPESIPLFVTTTTRFQIEVSDPGKWPIESINLYYRTWNNNDGWTNWKIYEEKTQHPYDSLYKGFSLTDEGLHHIEYFAEVDEGNREQTIHKLICMVDDTAPETIAKMYGPIIFIDATDYGGGKRIADISPYEDIPEFLPVWLHHIHYRYKFGEDGSWTTWKKGSLNQNIIISMGRNYFFGKPIYLEYYSIDMLNNRENIHQEMFESNPYFPF